MPCTSRTFRHLDRNFKGGINSDWQEYSSLTPNAKIAVNKSRKTTQHFVHTPSELKMIAVCHVYPVEDCVKGLQGNLFKLPFNIVGCYMLCPFAHPVACCWMLLRVVAQSMKTVKLFSQQLRTFLLFRDRRSVAQQCGIRLHRPSNIVGANGLQRLMGCILPTMHCRSQHCWELLHPFAQHCQHACNDSQHCWRNNVGSCCVRLHTA